MSKFRELKNHFKDHWWRRISRIEFLSPGKYGHQHLAFLFICPFLQRIIHLSSLRLAWVLCGGGKNISPHFTTVYFIFSGPCDYEPLPRFVKYIWEPTILDWSKLVRVAQKTCALWHLNNFIYVLIALNVIDTEHEVRTL